MSSNQRIVGLVTILGQALLMFSLMEREARRALGPAATGPDLLAGHVAARPPSANLLKALRAIALATVAIAGQRYRLVAERNPPQRPLPARLHVPELAHAPLAAAPT